MARIRTVKPDFCTSKDVGALNREARLFFLQLLTEADDEGRLFWIPRRIAAVLYPHDNDVTPEMVESWAAECSKRGMVLIYDTPAGTALQITAWSKHQKISHPKTSKIDPPSGNPPESIRKSSGNPPEVIRPEVEVEVEVEREVSGKPDRAKFDDFWKAYPRKEAKDRAEAWWKTHKPTTDDLTAMLAAIDWQRRDGCLKPASADGRSLVPLPASWLNAGRWKDERPGSEPKPLQPQVPRCIEPGCPNPGAPIWNGKCAVHHAHSQPPKRVAA